MGVVPAASPAPVPAPAFLFELGVALLVFDTGGEASEMALGVVFGGEITGCPWKADIGARDGGM